MNGLTTASTWAMLIGLANAPSGVGDFLSSRLSVAAWRASMVWIDSAAARISLLLIFGRLTEVRGGAEVLDRRRQRGDLRRAVDRELARRLRGRRPELPGDRA